jgi:uncharacterized protein YidB (DUF937 family)
MGILDGIIGKVLGGGGQKDLAGALMGILNDPKIGGLSGLVEQLQGKGLGDIVNSWVSTGQNLPITSQQVQHGLGTTVISQIASKAGISADDAASTISRLLPQVVDKLTPEGKIPEGDIMAQGMNVLKSLMK